MFEYLSNHVPQQDSTFRGLRPLRIETVVIKLNELNLSV